MESVSYAKVPTAKRFVVEDSITKVTSDGEPHGLLTIIAGLSGLFAAIVILAVLASLIGCKKSHKKNRNCKRCASALHPTQSTTKLTDSVASTSSNRSSISTIYHGGAIYTLDDDDVQRIGLKTLSNNLEGNLNSAFVGSELNLHGSLRKKKKKTHWSEEVEEKERAKHTTIDIERY